MDNKKLFNEIKSFCYGKENGESAQDVANWVLVKGDKRALRRVCSAINSDLNVDGIISTSGKIYVCKTKDECVKAISNTYRMAIAYFKKARVMETKVGLNGQFKMNKDGTDIMITYEGK